ncbi:hypothetical protein AYI69_g10405 [Smittium culicis]|uniref:Uncharacterized protein n=1 Tax=Smittium culicis TaxID=133412 RepID=A0A1R1X605_9FUNG|nr:hypothetical protein AYI69_g10405 [Smittium culicis]
MSQDGTNIQDPASVPECSMKILHRISHLEAQRTPIPENSDASSNLNGISRYFFKYPITNSEGKKSLERCPRKTGMVYEPTFLNEMGFSRDFKKHIATSQAISKTVLTTEPQNRKRYNSTRCNKPAFDYQTLQEIIQDIRPIQHKPEGQANFNGGEIEYLPQGVVETHKRPLDQFGYTGGLSDPSSDLATDCCQKRTKVEKISVKPREPGRNGKINIGIYGKKGYRRDFESETGIFLSNV